MDHYDLIVIGAGPAGEKGAAQAAYFGKRVALVERAPHPGGGPCGLWVNRDGTPVIEVKGALEGAGAHE